MNNSAASKRPGFSRPPVLVFPLEVWHQMLAYVQACPIEVGGLGHLRREGDIFFVEEVVILEQVATHIRTTTEANTLARYLSELLQEGRDPSRLRLQWHSHVDGEAYFSGTDLDNLENHGEWMFNLVLNKRGQCTARLDTLKPFRTWTPVEVRIIVQPSNAQVELACHEIAAKVRDGNRRRKNVIPESTIGFVTIDPSQLESGN